MNLLERLAAAEQRANAATPVLAEKVKDAATICDLHGLTDVANGLRNATGEATAALDSVPMLAAALRVAVEYLAGIADGATHHELGASDALARMDEISEGKP